MGIAEFDELLEIIKSNTDVSMLCETLLQIEDETLINRFYEIDEEEFIKTQYEDIKESRKVEIKD